MKRSTHFFAAALLLLIAAIARGDIISTHRSPQTPAANEKGWHQLLYQDFENGLLTPWERRGSIAEQWRPLSDYDLAPPDAGHWYAYIYEGDTPPYYGDSLLSPRVAINGYSDFRIKCGVRHNADYSTLALKYRIKRQDTWQAWQNARTWPTVPAIWDSVFFTATGDSMRICFYFYSGLRGSTSVDNISLCAYHADTHDMTPVTIDSPVTIDFPTRPFHPTITIGNMGTSCESGFWTHYQINDNLGSMVYFDSLHLQPPDSIDSNQVRQLVFPTLFYPALDRYVMSARTSLPGDQWPYNDTLTRAYYGYHGYWESWFPLRYTTEYAAEVGMGGRAYVIGGKTEGRYDNKIQYYDTLDKTWGAANSTFWYSMDYFSAVAARGCIFINGGRTTLGVYKNTTQVFYPVGDSVRFRASMPTPAANHAAAVWRDSLIYRIGGSDGTSVSRTIEVYDITWDSWSVATSLPSRRRSHAAGIIGDTIVVTTGADSTTWATATTYIGVIDTLNPTRITWTTGRPYPGGNNQAAQFGVVGRHLFVIGGYLGLVPGRATYSYSPGSDTWSAWPGKPTKCAGINGAAVVGNWIMVAGGTYATAATEALYVLPSFTGLHQPPPFTSAVDNGHMPLSFPNPFSHHATIHFNHDRTGCADISIYSITGQLVRTLMHARLPAGPHSETWDGRDQKGHRVPSGVYFCRLSTGQSVQTQRMILIK